MGNIFELLLEKLNAQLYDLNMGCAVNEKELAECWHLLHILHYASCDTNSDTALYKVLDYYG